MTSCLLKVEAYRFVAALRAPLLSREADPGNNEIGARTALSARNEISPKTTRTRLSALRFLTPSCVSTLIVIGWLMESAMVARASRLEIEISPQFAGESVQPNSLRYQTAAGEAFSITRLSYLLSGFALQNSDGSWVELTNQAAWLDLEKGRSTISIPDVQKGSYRGVRFYVGLDPELNHARPEEFPANHPLNPNLNGLHWSWQGGYIFMALEGMWRTEGRPYDGWSFHLARDTNRTGINLAVPLELGKDTKIEMAFDVSALLNVPHPLSFVKDGTSTHSREGDPIARTLAANLPGAFHVRRVNALSTTETTSTRVSPLYLPERYTPYQFEMSATFPVPDLPRDNPLIQERVELGKKLFHDPALSRDNTISCASCHQSEYGFGDPRRYSPGVEGRTGARHAMPLFNLAWKSSFFWDGRAPSLRAQALFPIQDHAEMDQPLTNLISKLSEGSPLHKTLVGNGARLSQPQRGTNIYEVLNRPSQGWQLDVAAAGTAALRSWVSELCLEEGQDFGKDEYGGHAGSPTMLTTHCMAAAKNLGSVYTDEDAAGIDYPALFNAAFGSPEITAEKIGLALEQFVLTLVSSDSRFDRAMKGEAILTDREKRGFELFMTEYDPRRNQFGADCFHCHGGALFQSQTFANNGLDAVCVDAGRAKVTESATDAGKFATPSLRNVALRGRYMHDGRFTTLEEVVEHYSTGVRRSATLDPNLAKHPDGGIHLSREDKDALVAFLKTLTDERFASRAPLLSAEGGRSAEAPPK